MSKSILNQMEQLHKKDSKCDRLNKKSKKFVLDNMDLVLECAPNQNTDKCKKFKKKLEDNDNKFIKECITDQKKFLKLKEELKKDLVKKMTKLKKSTKKTKKSQKKRKPKRKSTRKTKRKPKKKTTRKTKRKSKKKRKTRK